MGQHNQLHVASGSWVWEVQSSEYSYCSSTWRGARTYIWVKAWDVYQLSFITNSGETFPLSCFLKPYLPGFSHLWTTFQGNIDASSQSWQQTTWYRWRMPPWQLSSVLRCIDSHLSEKWLQGWGVPLSAFSSAAAESWRTSGGRRINRTSTSSSWQVAHLQTVEV